MVEGYEKEKVKHRSGAFSALILPVSSISALIFLFIIKMHHYPLWYSMLEGTNMR